MAGQILLLTNRFWRPFMRFVGLILAVGFPVGCAQSGEELETIDYAPRVREDWEVSTPEE